MINGNENDNGKTDHINLDINKLVDRHRDKYTK